MNRGSLTMIERQEIESEVIQVLAEMLHREAGTIRPQSSLMDDLEMDSFTAIEMLFELLKQSLDRCDDVMISGFGKFSVREKHQRRGRNPQTVESMALPPRTVVTFHYSTVLKEKVNAGDTA